MMTKMATKILLLKKIHKTICLVLFLTGSLVSIAPAQDYEGAITAKMTEIRWKQDELQAAKRELAILEEFLYNYENKVRDIEGICQRLTDANTTLEGIQQDNLVKLTILMGIQTYSEVSDAINLGKGAAQAMITNGIKGVVSHVAQEQTSKYLTNEAKAALGLDDETLSKPRVQKIKAVSDAARASYPELDRVQRMLALSLEAVKSAAYQEDGTELGDTGAILRKNIMVRDEIAIALSVMEGIKTKAVEAKSDADANLPLAQEEVTRLENELQALQNELDVLKGQLEQAEYEAREAANAAAVPDPVELPVSSRGAEESLEDYRARICDEAQAVWKSESPELLEGLVNTQGAIETGQNEIDSALAPYIKYPGTGYYYGDSELTFDVYIFKYGDGDALNVDIACSYTGSISEYTAVQEAIDDMILVEAALPGLINKIEALENLYNNLYDYRNKLTSLGDFVGRSCLDGPDTTGWYLEPGMGQDGAELLAIRLDQRLEQLKVSIQNANSLKNKLGAATDAWGSGIVFVQVDIDSSLEDAETALAGIISRAGAWEGLLAGSSGLVLGQLDPEKDIYTGLAEDPPFFSGRLGHFSEDPDEFTHILKHAFNMQTYKTSLLNALIIPGSEGLAAACSLRAKYDTLVAGAPEIKDAYDAAWQAYNSAFGRLESYAKAGSLLPYDDWQQAAAYTSDAHPVDTSTLTDQAVRFLRLYNTSHAVRRTTLTGSAPGGNEEDDEILIWGGLPRMSQIMDPGLDEPEEYFPHRIIAMKEVIVVEGLGWISLPENEFLLNIADVGNRLSDMKAEAFDDADLASLTVLDALEDELEALRNAYYEGHSAPEITVQPVGPASPIQAGGTVNLSVTATGDLLTYKWSMATELNYSLGLFTEIEGAISDNFTTPVLVDTCWFRVEVKNPGGSVFSDPVRVEVSGGSSGIVFTSAASASGQVG